MQLIELDEKTEDLRTDIRLGFELLSRGRCVLARHSVLRLHAVAVLHLKTELPTLPLIH